MRANRTFWVAAGAAALLLPMAASAQSWGGQGQYWTWPAYGRGQDVQDGGGWAGADRYGQDRGGWTGRGQWNGGGDYERDPENSWFKGFPEFAGVRQHLKEEIADGQREGWLTQEQAQRIVARYREIERDEYREFREHGWSLPDGDRQQFRARLDRLDRRLDDLRDDDGDYRGGGRD